MQGSGRLEEGGCQENRWQKGSKKKVNGRRKTADWEIGESRKKGNQEGEWTLKEKR